MFPSDFNERLHFKLSEEVFHDMWNIGGFVVLFIFATLTLTLVLSMCICWCCKWSKMNRVGVMPVPPIEEPEKITVACQTSQPEPAVEVVVPVPECTTAKNQHKNVQNKKWKWFQSKKTSNILPV